MCIIPHNRQNPLSKWAMTGQDVTDGARFVLWSMGPDGAMCRRGEFRSEPYLEQDEDGDNGHVVADVLYDDETMPRTVKLDWMGILPGRWTGKWSTEHLTIIGAAPGSTITLSLAS